MKHIILLFISFLLVYPAFAERPSWVHGQQGRVYKWVDAKGDTHYTQYPPDHREYIEVDRASVPPQAVDTSGEAEADDQAPGTADAAPAQGGQLTNEQRMEQNCVTARNNLAILETPTTNIAYTDTEGNSIKMDDSERAARIETAKKQIAEFCK